MRSRNALLAAALFVVAVGLAWVGTAPTLGISNILRNGSFESGTATTARNWETNAACGDPSNQITVERPTPNPRSTTDQAANGHSYVRLQTPDSSHAGSLCQTATYQASAGDYFLLTFSTRSTASKRIGSGMVELRELGADHTQDVASLAFPADWTWREFSVGKCATNRVKFSVQAKLYPNNNSSIEIDDVRLSIRSAGCKRATPYETAATPVAASDTDNILSDPHFNETGWSACPNPNYFFNPGIVPVGRVIRQIAPVASGSHGSHLRLRTDTASGSANRVCDRWNGVPLPGQTTVLSVWVKSTSGRIQGSFGMSVWQEQLDPNGDFLKQGIASRSRTFAATDREWTEVSVEYRDPLSPVAWLHGPATFRAELVITTPDAVLLIDEATFTATTVDGLRSPGPPNVITLGPSAILTGDYVTLSSWAVGSCVDGEEFLTLSNDDCRVVRSEPATGGFVLNDLEDPTVCFDARGPSFSACDGSRHQIWIDTPSPNLDMTEAAVVRRAASRDRPGEPRPARQTSLRPLSNPDSCLTRPFAEGEAVTLTTCDETNAQLWGDAGVNVSIVLPQSPT